MTPYNEYDELLGIERHKKCLRCKAREAHYLGVLNGRLHYACPDCGFDWSKPLPEE